MRFVTAQLLGYVADDIWLRNARNANAMASRISAGLTGLGLSLAYPTQANEVFVRIPSDIADGVRAEGFEVNEDELDGSAARFVAAWNTQPDEVDQLLGAVQKHAQKEVSSV